MLVACAETAGASTYIDPTFFGQHLAFFPSSGQVQMLHPPWTVNSMRLWDAGVTWCDLEPQQNQFNWSLLDNWVKNRNYANADFVYTFGNPPEWAVNGLAGGCLPGSIGNLPPSRQSLDGFLQALVQHVVQNYPSKLKYFELWNEFDSSTYWMGSVSQMVTLAHDAASAIHGATQGLKLLTPSVTPYDGDGANYQSCQPGGADDPNGTLEQLLGQDHASTGDFDIVNVRTYTQSPQGQGLWPEQTLPQWLCDVHNAMQAGSNGYGSYPLWSSEGSWGANSWFSGYDGTPGADFVARYDLLLLSYGVSRAYWYAYGNTAWGTLFDSSTGQLTPAGTATAQLAQTSPTLGWLNGATLTSPCSEDTSTTLWTCQITRPNGYAGLIAWVSTPNGTASVSTSGYTTVRTLDGGSSPITTSTLTVDNHPRLLEN